VLNLDKPFKTAGILGLVSLGIYIIGWIVLAATAAANISSFMDFGTNPFAFLSAIGSSIAIFIVAGLISLVALIFMLIGYFNLGKKMSIFTAVAIIMIAMTVLSWVPVLGILLALAYFIVTGVAFVKLAKATKDNVYMTYAVSLFVGILVIPLIFTVVMHYITMFRLDKELGGKALKKK
jgi:hypothetical protein